MDNCEIQPHLCVKASQVRPVAIVVGDPKRAEQVAAACEKHKEVAYNREYRTFDCYQSGQYFTVTSHGVGSAGAAICFEELIKLGVKILIRVGTAGSLQPKTIKQGDIVICHSAAREDGHTQLYVPAGFPAVADISIFDMLKKTAEKLKVPVQYGATLTSDLFYASPVVPSTLETYSKAGIEIVEMEIATLFIIAKIRKVKAAAICCIDGSPLKWEEGDYAPSGDKVVLAKKKMIELVIAAVVQLSVDMKR